MKKNNRVRALTSAGRAAQSNISVLIIGESGTGKEILTRAVRDLERRLIREVLAAAPNRSESIRSLGISRRTFYLKLKEYGLE